jgi:hypothetical protein
MTTHPFVKPHSDKGKHTYTHTHIHTYIHTYKALLLLIVNWQQTRTKGMIIIIIIRRRRRRRIKQIIVGARSRIPYTGSVSLSLSWRIRKKTI